MIGARFSIALAIVASLSLFQGCRKHQPRAVIIPKPVISKPAPMDPLPPPGVDLTAAGQEPPLEPPEPPEVAFPPPPQRRSQPKKTRRTVVAAAAAPAPKAEPDDDESDSSSIPLPQLGEVLSVQQQRDYSREIEDTLSRTRRMLAQITGRNLTERQKEVYGQVQDFLRQVDAAKYNDLVFSRTVALRAEVLTKDLIESIR